MPNELPEVCMQCGDPILNKDYGVVNAVDAETSEPVDGTICKKCMNVILHEARTNEL